jgi:hypothetical protein
MRDFIVVAASVLILFTAPSLSCSMKVAGLSKFDDQEYIFIGEVIGYIQPISIRKFEAPAAGIIVRPKDIVYSPMVPQRNFEVFPLVHTPYCAPEGQSLETLSTSFPLNSEVRIIGRVATVVPRVAYEGNLAIETQYRHRGSVALNRDETRRSVTTSQSIFDYRSIPSETYWKSKSLSYLDSFEARKDLLRLKSATIQQARNELLGRLAYAPWVQLDEGLFRTYAANVEESRRYYEIYIGVRNPEYLKQYQLFNSAFDELIQMGYREYLVKSAIRHVQIHSRPGTKEELLKLTLILLQKSRNRFSQIR